MSLSDRALQALNEHWAVAAIGAGEIERAGDLACQRLARRAVGRQIRFSFEERAEDEPFLERVALAYELAAIEGLDELSRLARWTSISRRESKRRPRRGTRSTRWCCGGCMRRRASW